MSNYVENVEFHMQGLTAITTGPCPGCNECRELYGFDSQAEFDVALETGDVCAEPSFSWSGCDICRSRPGGDKEEWHAIDENGELVHGDHACVDCVYYLATGGIPDRD